MHSLRLVLVSKIMAPNRARISSEWVVNAVAHFWYFQLCPQRYILCQQVDYWGFENYLHMHTYAHM